MFRRAEGDLRETQRQYKKRKEIMKERERERVNKEATQKNSLGRTHTLSARNRKRSTRTYGRMIVRGHCMHR